MHELVRDNPANDAREKAEIEFSVVIVSYNDIAGVLQCLSALEENNDLGDRLEIILVDNSPVPDVRIAVEEHHPSVRIIQNKNRGFGEANNRGVQIARGEFLLLLNPDTKLLCPILRRALHRFRSNQRLGVFGVQLVDDTRAPQQSFFWIDGGGVIRSLSLHFFARLGWFIPGLMCTSGADIFIRKEVFSRAGGFDELIFLYNEEADLCRRVLKDGWEWSFFRDSEIYHREGGTTSSIAGTALRLDSLKIYCEKYHLDYSRRLRRELRYARLTKNVRDLLGRPDPDADQPILAIREALLNHRRGT